MTLNELAAAAKEDHRLVEPLQLRTWPALERFAERYGLKHSIEASDLTQEFALVFERYVNRFDPRFNWNQYILQRFKWFCLDVNRMARHQPICNYRSAKGKTLVQSVSANQKTIDGGDCVELVTLIAKEYRNPKSERQAFMDRIAELPRNQRLILSLYYIEQKTMTAIAKSIGLSRSRVSQIHNDAIKTLRETAVL